MLDSVSGHTSDCLVFMPARNCEMYAADAIRSLARQSFDGIHVLYVDDASQDRTGEIARHYLQELFPGRHSYIRNETQFGKSRNVWEHLRPRAGEFEFIAILDADDQLADVAILEKMSRRYQAGKDVVWTNFFTDRGHQGKNCALDPRRSPREQRWSTSHFFSFRAALLPPIPESYFKDDAGDWFMGACDVALALPVLDQTRNYDFLPDLAYRYTMTNPLSLHNSTPAVNEVTSKLQLKNSNMVFSKPPLPLLKHEDTPVTDAPTSPAPAARPAPRSTDQIWQDQAATLLFNRYPGLLAAKAVAVGAELEPLQLLSLSQSLERMPGPVLFIGPARTAALVSALVAGHPECTLTCLLDGESEAPALRAQLHLSGLAKKVSILPTTRARVQMDGKECSFPASAVLAGADPFSVVIVDARGEENEDVFAILALPALSEHIVETGFHFCTLTSSSALAERVVKRIGELTVGLQHCLGGIGGTGIVTFPAQQG